MSIRGQNVTGKTAISFTLACPVGHVRTPAAFNALAASRGADALMIPLELQARELAAFLQTMRTLTNVAGAVVTVPHKREAARLCDELSTRAEQCEAVNVVRRTPGGRLFGDIFDGLGFIEGLRRAGHEIEGRRVLLAGAGGAASAIAFAFAEARVAKLGVFNRTEQRARHLVDRLRRSFRGASVASPDPRGFDVVVNATSLGLRPEDPAPVDVSGFTADMLVAEVVMQPERTALIEAALAAGARVQPGQAMLDAQLELIADFLGAKGP